MYSPSSFSLIYSSLFEDLRFFFNYCETTAVLGPVLWPRGFFTDRSKAVLLCALSSCPLFILSNTLSLYLFIYLMDTLLRMQLIALLSVREVAVFLFFFFFFFFLFFFFLLLCTFFPALMPYLCYFVQNCY